MFEFDNAELLKFYNIKKNQILNNAKKTEKGKGKIKKKLGWSKHTPGLLLRLFPAD
jgi:hypothetical protein